MIDRRQERRARTLLSGNIVFDGHNHSMDCTLRNLGPYGAMAEHSETFRIPPEFDLMIPHRKESHRARVVWRRHDVVGLALAPAEPAAADARKPERKVWMQGKSNVRRKPFVLGY